MTITETTRPTDRNKFAAWATQGMTDADIEEVQEVTRQLRQVLEQNRGLIARARRLHALCEESVKAAAAEALAAGTAEINRDRILEACAVATGQEELHAAMLHLEGEFNPDEPGTA